MAPTEKALAVVALLLVAWLNSGIASQVAHFLPGALKWGLFGLWVGVAALRDSAFRRTLLSGSWPLVALLAYSLAATLWGAEGLMRYHYGFGYLLIVYAIFAYYSRAAYRPIRVVLLGFLVLDATAIGVNTWFALDINSGVSRILAIPDPVRSELLHGVQYYFVGSYTYVYSLGALAVFLCGLLLRHSRRRWLVGALLVASWLLMIKMSFAIAVLLTLAFTVTLALKKSVHVFSWRATTLGSVVAAGVVAGIAAALVHGPPALSGFSPTLRLRLAEISALLLGSGVDGTNTEARLDLYLESVITFTNNVALGVAASPDSRFSSGEHSEWLDLLAQFGLVGLLFVFFLLKAYRLTVSRVGSHGRSLIHTTWAYFVLLGFLNPFLFAHLFVTWFLFIPFAVSLLVTSEASTRRGHDPGARPRVLMIHHSGAIGGGSKSLLDVLEMLRPEYDIVVVAPEEPPALASLLRSAPYDYRPAALPFPLFNHYNGGSRLLSRTFLSALPKAYRTRAAWTRFIRSVDPEIVMVNSAVLAPLGPAIRAAGAVPICMVRETFPTGGPASRTRFLMRALDREFDGVVFLSEHDRDRAKLNRAQSVVVRDCFSASSLSAVSRETACRSLGVAAERFNILFVGGESPIKGLDVALAALDLLEPRDIQLIVAGEVSTAFSAPKRIWTVSPFVDRRAVSFAKELQSLLKRPALVGRVKLVGVQSDAALMYAAADVVIFPSTSPHQARPAFEAGANRLPVVISDFEETVDLVQHEVNGLTFVPGDAKGLAAQLLRLYNDRQLSRDLGEGNHEIAMRDHDFETEQPRLLEFVNAIRRQARDDEPAKEPRGSRPHDNG